MFNPIAFMINVKCERCSTCTLSKSLNIQVCDEASRLAVGIHILVFSVCLFLFVRPEWICDEVCDLRGGVVTGVSASIHAPTSHIRAEKARTRAFPTLHTAFFLHSDAADLFSSRGEGERSMSGGAGEVG